MSTRAVTASLIDHLRHGLGLPIAHDLVPVNTDLARLAAAHRVDRLLDSTTATAEAEELLLRLRTRSAQQSLRLRYRLRQILTAFTDAGLPVLTFKGTALALQTGRSPAERAGGDIDLLIHPEDWVAAHQLLAALGHHLPGYPEPGHDQRTRFVRWTYCEAPYRHPVGTIDLHWRVVTGHLPGMTMRSLWVDHVEIDDAGFALPTFHPDAALAHVAIHGAKDRWTSLRSIVDAHLLLEHGASWEGAEERVPIGRSIPECRAGLDVLRSGEPIPTSPTNRSPHERVWLTGMIERPGVGEDHRPAGGTITYMRGQMGITPNLTSRISMTANALVRPDSLTKPAVPARWWWICIPARLLRLARRRIVIAGRALGLSLQPPPLD